jgi:hypothetical protein
MVSLNNLLAILNIMKSRFSSKFLFFVLAFLTFTITTLYAQNTKCKCCTEAHNAFDFWKGDWQAFTPDGKLAGTNTIEKIQDNCILRENWINANGTYTGTSYNFYNQHTQKWEQIWIDNQGQHLHLTGGLQNGSMVLQSSGIPKPDGSLLINRITWTPLKTGYVRQHWQTKTSNSNWVTVFNGIYKPVVSQE